MTQSAVLTQNDSRVHWTARVGFSLPLLVGALGLLSFALSYARGGFLFLSPESWSSFTRALNSIAVDGLAFLPLPTLILSAFALFLARQPSWRRGRKYAILGCIMNLLLCVFLP